MGTRTNASLHDVYHKYNFVLSFDGVNVAGFSKVSGLKQEVNVIEYREGNNPIYMRKMPGLIKYDNITAEYGMTFDSSAWRYILTYADGGGRQGGDNSGTRPTHDRIRKTADFSMLDRSGAVQKTWTLHDAWISEWSMEDVDASQNEVLIEKIVITYEYFDLTKG